MTKEEFGLDLFEAIMCCGGVLQLQQLREKTPPQKIKPSQLTQWQQHEKELLHHAQNLVAGLSDVDAGEIVRRYPFLLAYPKGDL